MLKVVIDTNVFISATLTPRGNPAKVLKAWQEGKIDLVISPQILKEIKKVIFRPRIKKLSSWTDKKRDELIQDLAKIAILTPGSLKLKVVAEDPYDDKFVVAAVEGKANYIVTGDEHLRKLRSCKGIKVVSPAEFVKILRQKGIR